MIITHNLLQYVIHIDAYLVLLLAEYGTWIYAILFLIIFCETGLVITPFLPGDSLLFAAGSMSLNKDINIQILFLLLIGASILGNKLNFLIGKMIGPRVFSLQNAGHKSMWSILFNQKYLNTAHQFYELHGGKTIIFARFIPIVRTFAPFVAGAANMSLSSFTFYNVVSAILWIGSLLTAGYCFGSLPFIKQHISLVIYTIIIISLLPPVIGVIYRKYHA
jgi:membrane-associated protein